VTGKYLVVGGHSGIGKATADMLSDDPGNVLCVPDSRLLDVTSWVRIDDYLVANGPFDYIVYSAGVNQLAWIEELSAFDSMIKRIFDVNVYGLVEILSLHIRQFGKDRGASVVAVSSDAAELPMRGSLAYCASKAALDMAIRCAARELAPAWRINGVAPGMVEGTPMTEYIDNSIPEFRGWTMEKAREYEKSQVPTGRRATLGEVAKTICWVLHGPAQMTGEIVKINGGRS
jgi:NAD(P)-dependent dehydrogenase (short-subunit alcohol dehydrogenase family)